MSVLDAPFRTLASTLTKTFGKTGTIEYVSTGAYSPTTGRAGQTKTMASVRGVVENFQRHETAVESTSRAGDTRSGNVLRGDLKWTIRAKGVDRPSPNDTVTFADTLDSHGNVKRFAVIRAKSILSGDLVAAYEVQLRG